jgi:hypothetical protein
VSDTPLIDPDDNLPEKTEPTGGVPVIPKPLKVKFCEYKRGPKMG